MKAYRIRFIIGHRIVLNTERYFYDVTEAHKEAAKLVACIWQTDVCSSATPTSLTVEDA